MCVGFLLLSIRLDEVTHNPSELLTSRYTIMDRVYPVALECRTLGHPFNPQLFSLSPRLSLYLSLSLSPPFNFNFQIKYFFIGMSICIVKVTCN